MSLAIITLAVAFSLAHQALAKTAFSGYWDHTNHLIASGYWD